MRTASPPVITRPQQTVMDFSGSGSVSGDRLELARVARNDAWKDNGDIPAWVVPEDVDLDRFFTRPEVASKCWRSLVDAMRRDHALTDSYRFIEPSAGEGAFYDLLPEDRRIGIDIVPGRSDYETADFLSWFPKPNGRRSVVVGNPPFGYRAWLALAFVNHAATFSDYIGMILPMAFQSEGKGSPKHRVVGAELMETMPLPPDSFVTDTGRPVKVNALWQVWKRGVNNRVPDRTCDDWIDIFTVDTRKERMCGHDRMDEADWFLQRTFYADPPTLVRDFSYVRYVCGYGIVIRKDRERVTEALLATDWRRHSNLAAHDCRHISMCHIRAAMVEAGFVDD